MLNTINHESNHFFIISIELYNTFYFFILDVNEAMLFTTEKDIIISTDVQNKHSDTDLIDVPIHYGKYIVKISSTIAD